MTKSLKKYIWLAILAHVLLLLFCTLQWVFDPALRFEKKSERYLPAYLYQDASQAPRTAPRLPEPVSPPQQMPEPPQNNLAKLALQKKLQQKTHPPEPLQRRSKSAAAFMPAESPQTGKPLNEPLLKELSRATAAKLYYPPEAAAFHLKGTVIIRFLLHPDGRVEEVSIAHSSGFHLLDEAAFNSIKAISPVRDANLYLTKARYLFAGIIFG